MDKVAQPVLDYFRPPREYFWRWADGTAVIEWMDGSTICYREDLLYILKNLGSGGIPRIGSILLVLSACKEDWKKSGGIGILTAIKMLKESANLSLADAKQQVDSMSPALREAFAFLELVNELPVEYRRGAKRVQLLENIFAHAGNKICGGESRLLISEFESGQLDEVVHEPGPVLTVEHFTADLVILAEALKRFPDTELLELKVRTGVTDLPAPLPLETEVPEFREADLMDQLSDDPKTSGLARLTRRLVAALNIPMHAHGSSDQSFGGVSDITNRGEFDRLLLSELAHDDVSLVARLANNEALYLRREELPSNRDHKRFILIDTTIRMWGVPRVFALAAALACATKKKNHTTVIAFALGGNGSSEISLDTREGVIHALEQLDPSLHCGGALEDFMEGQPKSGRNEYFFITEDEAYHSGEFLPFLTRTQQALSYLVTVARDGSLAFSEFIAGRKKTLSTAKFDLDDLLFPSSHALQQVYSKDTPAFLQRQPAPLFYPPAKVLVNQATTFYSETAGVFAVTRDYRLLHWPAEGHGARELLQYIEKGVYAFGVDAELRLFILVQNHGRRLVKLYKIDLDNGAAESEDFSANLDAKGTVTFDDNDFYIEQGRKVFKLNVYRKEVTFIEDARRAAVLDSIRQAAGRNQKNNIWTVAGHINRNYHTLSKAKNIYVDANGHLMVDNRTFVLRNGSVMLESLNAKAQEELSRFGKHGPLYPASAENVTYDSVRNTYIRFTRYTWADGSQAVLDSRGLLHLSSSDKTIPEFSLLVLADRAVSGWAADNEVFGIPFFTGKKGIVTGDNFFTRYLLSFISRIEA